ncbi:unnamed protein product [Ceutorhynchus assimilis]|uniref:Uncharacterized protein n=1 Tax=Ceutorhynchus assimilis TaxID=467358 RepID=A0A9N9MW70_9CUCU|nr:unnamed protein product [Ceutorhynchus assimilis]CAG9768499.1 unnamed protein product [Ceutorhynchus assimilis]
MDKSTQTDFDQCYCAVTRFSQPPSTSPNQQEPPNSGGLVRLRYKRTVSKKSLEGKRRDGLGNLVIVITDFEQ